MNCWFGRLTRSGRRSVLDADLHTDGAADQQREIASVELDLDWNQLSSAPENARPARLRLQARRGRAPNPDDASLNRLAERVDGDRGRLPRVHSRDLRLLDLRLDPH